MIPAVSQLDKIAPGNITVSDFISRKNGGIALAAGPGKRFKNSFAVAVLAKHALYAFAFPVPGHGIGHGEQGNHKPPAAPAGKKDGL